MGGQWLRVSPLIGNFLFEGLCVSQATSLNLIFFLGWSGPRQSRLTPGLPLAANMGTGDWSLSQNSWGALVPLREARGSPEWLVLGQEIPVTGIFIPGSLGTGARASDMAECGKGNCV